MTLLEDVERMLEERVRIGDVVVVGREDQGYLVDGNTIDKYGHRVEFLIAPTQGLYSARHYRCILMV